MFRPAENIVDSMYLANFIKMVFGGTVYRHQVDENNQVVAKLSPVGLAIYLFWCATFVAALYLTVKNDYSMIRIFYDTQLQGYGDLFQNLLDMVYVIYAIWKLPINMTKSTKHYQVMMDIDSDIKNNFTSIDYSKTARAALFAELMLRIVAFSHLICLFLCVSQLNTDIPYALLYQIYFSDSLALQITIESCFYLYLLKSRYFIVNEQLHNIQISAVCNQTLRRTPHKHAQLKAGVKNMRDCGRLYGMLYKAGGASEKIYGFALVFTMFVNVLLIVMMMFYIMEANAHALYKINTTKYTYFMIFTCWQIVHSLYILFLNIYFAEKTADEGKYAAVIAHSIVNTDCSPSITTMAMRFSQQLLHQSPSFSATGAYKLQYLLLLQGARSLVTFLIILMQFVSQSVVD